MVAAVVYCRISDDRAGQGLGVRRQEQDCRVLCEREAWAVAEVIVDNDRSAYSGKHRPGYERLLQGLRDGLWDAVVAWHPDRLHRSPKELEAFIDTIDAAKAKVATVQAGHVDLSSAAGRMTARVVGAVARHESEQKSERIRRKHQELAEAGHPVGGGGRPFGYCADRLTINPAEAGLVREAARQILDGMTLRSIARDWTVREVPTVTGTGWTTTVLRRILTAPRTAGFREHAGKRYPGTWEPLLDEMTWRRVRAVLLDPDRRRNTAPRLYLLTGGLARCALCGSPLVARPRSDHRRSYVCASGPGFGGCGKIRALAEPFERDVLTAAVQALRTSALPTPEPSTGALSAIDEVEASLAELATDYYADRQVTRAQFQAASATLQGRLIALRTVAADQERRALLPPDAVAVLEDGLDLARCRAVLTSVVHAVHVGPAVRGRNFYDPSRVRIEWAG